ncbi:hypothetical protein GCM10007304_01680 [Rhodococcoides trifolii]|uniref:Anti-sigma-M factor RsmA n=1 Tax=Rhodococcoides trifolii TaxID=908250 RepID=A0A917CLM1_9NOCA|nr:hypothetical protein [Rhodococcus trifolii]GGF91375.1 hypothetical protein GCM10007304_01680 [Rhodococcus trifolii]
MTDREIASDPAPPFSDELLADLHAGNLDPELAARLWPVVRADPASREVIESLDDVVSLLAARGSDLDAGAEVPVWVRDRLDSTLTRARPSSRRFSSTHAMLSFAAAAAVVIVAAVVGIGTLTSAPDTPPALAEGTSTGIEGTLVSGTIGRYDNGPFANPRVLRECLQANGIDPAATLLGSSSVTIDGRRATLLIVPGPVAPTLTALAVGDGCGAGTPDTVSRKDVG